jgi:glycine cleavage system H protein
MAVLLVVLTFVFFVALDALLARRRADRPVPSLSVAPQVTLVPVPEPEPVWVAGYQMPSDLHYHRGHTWARTLDRDTVVVGLDDFARRLLGDAQTIRLPRIGEALRQGRAAFTVGTTNGHERQVALVSPADGQVVEVNPNVDQTPRLATDDPYGRGWLLKLRGNDVGSNLNNLLSGSLARRWMEDSRERLELGLMALSGSVMQDGGEPVEDFARHLPDADWKRLAQTFFLT